MREIAGALGLSFQRVHQIVDVSTGKAAVKPRRVTRPTPAGEPSRNANLTCAFCGAAGTQVRKLIAGPTVFICDECVELCMDIIRVSSSAIAASTSPAKQTSQTTAERMT